MSNRNTSLKPPKKQSPPSPKVKAARNALLQMIGDCYLVPDSLERLHAVAKDKARRGTDPQNLKMFRLKWILEPTERYRAEKQAQARTLTEIQAIGGIQAIETMGIKLWARARLLDLASKGLCGKCLERKAELTYANVEPIGTLAEEITDLAETLAAETTDLRMKITAPRIKISEAGKQSAAAA